jgi:hypothetical protein
VNEWVQIALLLVCVVGAPFAIGWISGRQLGGLRGRLVGAALPFAGWTVRLAYDLSLPRSYDYGPEPAAELKQWIAASVVAGCVGALAATVFDRRRAKRDPVAGARA